MKILLVDDDKLCLESLSYFLASLNHIIIVASSAQNAISVMEKCTFDLVILDEIGRGTSTFDGMSIAWAVAEYLYEAGSMVLFATHYHELAQLAISKKRVRNYNIYVKEDRGEIVFVRKLIPGASNHSYGIEVANLAGVPERVINSAKRILAKIEKSHLSVGTSIRGGQMGLFENPEEEKVEDEKDKIIAELMELDPLSMSPLEAHSRIMEFKEKLGKRKNSPDN